MSKESEAPNKANFYPKDFVGPEPLLGSDARIPEQSVPSDIQALQEDVAYLFQKATVAAVVHITDAKDRLKEALTVYAEQKKEIERLKEEVREEASNAQEWVEKHRILEQQIQTLREDVQDVADHLPKGYDKDVLTKALKSTDGR